VDALLGVRWGEPLREMLAAAAESGVDEIVLPPRNWGSTSRCRISWTAE
jgi:hypothetical protein